MLIATLAVSLSAFSAGCEEEGTAPLDTATYYQDIKPIIDAKCVQCHYQGGVAPFSLETYEDVTTYAGVSKLAIEAGTMPPWPANNECADYVADRSLTEEHRSALLAWFDGDMAEGDPSDPGAPIETEVTTLSRVDLTISMTEPHTPQTAPGIYDDNRCFLIPWPEEAPTYVTGFRVKPSNESIVHHATIFLATPEEAAIYDELDASDPAPGYPCFGDTGGPASQWLGAWAPGSQGYDLPPDVGIGVQPGSLVVLQVHYSTLYAELDGEIAPDQTELEFKLDSQVAKPSFFLLWTNFEWLTGDIVRIPANQEDVMYSYAADPTVPYDLNGMQIHSAALHMHLLGSHANVTIERSDGASECLLQIDDWDFYWQDMYIFRQPKTLERGDELRVECHWDNSAANQPLVDGERLPPQDVYWGDDTDDEMCGTILFVSPL